MVAHNESVSVVVLNWNGRHHLGSCLTSVAQQTLPQVEIILVDNGSQDGSVRFVQRHYPNVKVVALPENIGFCSGNNAGINKANGQFIALLNNDTEVEKNWLDELLSAAKRHSDAGLFASKMLFFDDRTVIDTAGDEFHVAGFAAKRGWGKADHKPYNVEKSVFGACAGAVLYRRTMLESIGLLDDDFFANGEDVDLSFRALLKGYRCIYVPKAVVYHKGGATIGQNQQWFYLMRRNQLWVMVKNMPLALLIKYAPLVFCYNLLSVVYHCMQGRGVLIGRAYWHAFLGMPAMLRKRRRIQSDRRIPCTDVEAMLQKRGFWRRAQQPVTHQLTPGYDDVNRNSVKTNS
jgi:GT2 family glycosyltransferase